MRSWVTERQASNKRNREIFWDHFICKCTKERCKRSIHSISILFQFSRYIYENLIPEFHIYVPGTSRWNRHKTAEYTGSWIRRKMSKQTRRIFENGRWLVLNCSLRFVITFLSFGVAIEPLRHSMDGRNHGLTIFFRRPFLLFNDFSLTRRPFSFGICIQPNSDDTLRPLSSIIVPLLFFLLVLGTQ